MAKSKYSVGLKQLLIGDIASDGGMGTTLIELLGKNTVEGSASLESTEPQTEDIKVEESDDAIESIITDPGMYQFKLSSYNVSVMVLQALLGGELTGTEPNQSWEAPEAVPTVEKSVKAITKTNIAIAAPRVKLVTKLTWSLDKKKMAQLDITGTVLKPLKEGVKKLKIGLVEACLRREGSSSSPREKLTSPRGNLTSPRGNLTSPRENLSSPRGNLTSPRENLSSPRGNLTHLSII